MKKRAARGKPARRKANTRDIVGERKADPIAEVPGKWRKHFKNLVTLREQLTRRQVDLSSMAAEEAPNYSSHMADAATDAFDRDLALGMLSSEQNALYQIDQALDRIRNGSYGICELTGKPIEKARLEAVPWARFSLAAERMLEEQGAQKRATLGERESVGQTEATEEQEPEEAE